MRNRRSSSGSLLTIPVIFALSFFSSGCFTKRPPAAFTPPPPQSPSVAADVERVPDPPLVTSLPDLSGPSNGPGLVPNGVPEAPAPPAPKPSPPRRLPTTPPKPATTTPPDPQPQQTPRLGQILSPEQTREYNRTLDESLDRVRRVLTALGRKNLTPDQAEILNRIQVFQKQAEEKREQDLVIAVSLARRADLLAKDLQDRVP